jgi:rare lipoprotein A (peptidoglycan hydrolase)
LQIRPADADNDGVRLLRRTTLTAAVVAGLLGLPSPGQASSVEGLQAELAAAAARTGALSAELEAAAARDGGLRVALERLAVDQARAQARLDAQVRRVWITRLPGPLAWSARLGSPALRRIAERGAAAAVRVDRRLLETVSERSTAAAALRAEAASVRRRLQGQAVEALAAQESARALLVRAEADLTAQLLVAAAQAERDRLAARAAALGAARATLDDASAAVTSALAPALTPAQTRRSRRAQVDEAPMVELVEAAGAGYPTGYGPTGQVLRGLASWYGPGFVGSPTASGSPYDPERLTCAHTTLPLGTLLRVSANGRSVSCLVNDRGPYVGPRILDMSRAGSRALGYDGVAEVVIEVLAPG